MKFIQLIVVLFVLIVAISMGMQEFRKKEGVFDKDLLLFVYGIYFKVYWKNQFFFIRGFIQVSFKIFAYFLSIYKIQGKDLVVFKL